MVKIENWVTFREPVIITTESGDLYKQYGMIPPDMSIMDEKAKKRFGPYFPSEDFEFKYEEIKQNFIVMYLSISPKIRFPERSLEYNFIWFGTKRITSI